MPNASFKPSPNGKPPGPGDAEIASRIAKYERGEAKLIRRSGCVCSGSTPYAVKPELVPT